MFTPKLAMLYLRIGLAVAVVTSIGGLYAWVSVQKAQKHEAEAIAKDAQAKLKTAYEQIADMVVTQQVLDTALTQRDIEKQETQEQLRSASAELMRLRRQNAELRDWLDRPIPADVVRLLKGATGSAGGKAVPSTDASR